MSDRAVNNKTQREIVAWTLAALFDMGLIPRNAKAIARAAAVCRITVPEFKTAAEDPARVDFYPGETKARRRGDTVVPIARGGGNREPRPFVRTKTYKNMRWVDDLNSKDHPAAHGEEGGYWERRCSRCCVWKPADSDHFNIVDRSTGRMKSMCRDCQSEYQQERYFSVKKISDMRRAGITFIVAEGDPVLVCADCETELVPGDEALVEGGVHHATCHARNQAQEDNDGT